MQTVAFDLTATEWTEILGGNSWLKLQVKTSNRVRLHLNDSATAPALNAAFFLVESFAPAWDFFIDDVTGSGRIWARADETPAIVTVARKTAA
jgi:hypothetical protein